MVSNENNLIALLPFQGARHIIGAVIQNSDRFLNSLSLFLCHIAVVINHIRHDGLTYSRHPRYICPCNPLSGLTHPGRSPMFVIHSYVLSIVYNKEPYLSICFMHF